MVALRLTLLGGFDARLAAGDAVNLPAKKAQALLAYLGLRPGQTHQRDKLAALLWGQWSDEHARDGLRHALGALRKALPDGQPPSLRAEGQTLALNAAVVEVDVATFERRMAEGTLQALEQAVALYRGDLLLGFTVSEPLFEEWLVAERERLREIALEALARLLAHQLKSGGDRAGHPDGRATDRARSPAGSRAPRAHAALRPPGAAGGSAQAVPGMRGGAAAGAGGGARGGDEAALSGTAATTG